MSKQRSCHINSQNNFSLNTVLLLKISSLLFPKFIAKPPYGKLHGIIGKRLIFLDILLKPASFAEPHGQKVFTLADLTVIEHAVAGKSTNSIQPITRIQVAFGDGNHVTNRTAERLTAASLNNAARATLSGTSK